MKFLSAPVSLLLIVFALLSLTVSIRAGEGAWDTELLLPDFYGEGVGVGDLNGDGQVDLSYGPFWFSGPKFDRKIRFAEGDAFVPEKGYSDNFFQFQHDFNGDGRVDILVLGFPGKEARLYLNPGGLDDGEKAGADKNWEIHVIADKVSHESPHFVDLVPGGLPEIVCARDRSYGYYEAGEDATQPWIWHAISEEGDAAEPFGHGLGVGDVDGDGRLDVVERNHWYQQPSKSELADKGPWKKQTWSPDSYGSGGAQILVHDFDGDGDADIVTSYNAHGFGLGWFEQVDGGKFIRHDVMGASSTENPYGVAFSQLHALALCDIDGDGRMDFVVGKRHYAHQGKDLGGLQEPVLYWFRNAKSEGGGVDFVPYVIDHGLGSGVELKVVDVDGDGRLDVVSGSKQGLSIHKQRDALAGKAELWQVPGGRPQEGYGSGLSPKEALARMEVPEGFAVDLIASEPDLVQPIAMCFDSRGRLWVLEGMNYPQRGAEGEGKDRILIFEDADQDGSFETRKVFAENLNLASAIAVGFGGVYVGSAPYLLYYPDKNQDDIPDGEPEILLDGWGYQDTHETLNSFTWGPDGWLYGCHGVFTHSLVGAPGTKDEDRIGINAGLWRYHPVKRVFEVYAEGTSNPWGVDFDRRGDFFVSACVIPHFYHLAQGGRYQRQAGSHFNPWIFEDIKTITDHAHYAGSIAEHAFWGANKITRPAAPSDTSALGGGHAHCGLVIYQADVFPEAYRNNAFFHNLHGHRMVREALEGDGSGHVARHLPDFLLANHHDHIGVALEQGPDGSLFLSDWTDPQTCHHRDVEIWDRSNGRVYRVRYGEKRSTSVDLVSRSDAELVALLANPNEFHARHARRLLQERAAAGSLDREATIAALHQFEKAHENEANLRLRALWTRHVSGLLDEAQRLARLDDTAEEIRAWTVSLLGEDKGAQSDVILEKLTKMVKAEGGDESLFVRRHLASLLQRLPLEQRWGIAEGLIGHSLSGNDKNIPLLVWYGVEPLVESDADRALSLSTKTSWPMMKEFLARRAAVFEEGRAALMTSLSKAARADDFIARAKPLLDAVAKLSKAEAPKGWEGVKERAKALLKGTAKDSTELNAIISRLGVRFGDPEFFEAWRALARNKTKSAADRSEALTLLAAGRDAQVGEIARDLLNEGTMRPAAVSALRGFSSRETAEALVPLLGNLPIALRSEAIHIIAAKPDSALVLLKAVDEKKIDASLIAPAMLDQFARFGDKQIDELLEKNWVRGGSEMVPEKLAEAIVEWKKKLTPAVMARADAARGREIFANVCGVCHTLFGEGAAVGPDLTGSNRADLAYLLENVLTPSAVVGQDYLLHVYTMKDGSTLSGIVRKKTPETVQLAMVGGSVVDLKLADVARHEELPQSLMPPGLFNTLPLPDVAHLVRYLASANLDAAMSGGGQAQRVTPPAAAGTKRIEAEALAAKVKAPHGQVRGQGMKGFGKGWSGDGQLWWTGGQAGDVISLRFPEVAAGKYDVAVYPTMAKDYAMIRMSINGNLLETDLYNPKVVLGEPLYFKNVQVSPTEPLQIDIHIAGKNDAAVPSYMVGIDCIDVKKSE